MITTIFYLNYIIILSHFPSPQSGDFPLTESVYLMTFANFLLGKTPHGPGKYIFGCFNNADVAPFQVDYSCLTAGQEEN